MIIMEKAILDIAGMRCESCAICIELTLGKKKGIKNSKVYLGERSAIVEYDPVITTTSDIVKTINYLGYIATLKKEE